MSRKQRNMVVADGGYKIKGRLLYWESLACDNILVEF